MQKLAIGLGLSATIVLASCGQAPQAPAPDASVPTEMSSSPLKTGDTKITPQYLYVDKVRCPDQVSYVTKDVNKLDRYVCTFIAGGAGAVTTTITCAASVGWGCFAVGGATAGVLLGCTEVYAPKQVRYQVTKTYVADNFYNPPRCFLDRTIETPL